MKLPYYYAGLYGEGSPIVISRNVLDTYAPYLELNPLKIKKAFVLVPEENRLSVNSLIEEEGNGCTDSTAKLKIVLSDKSRWKATKEYKITSSTNLLHISRERESEDGVDKTLYSTLIHHFITVFPEVKSYISARDASVEYGRTVPDILSTNPKWEQPDKPRPFTHLVSAVSLKGKAQYILVLDSVINEYFNSKQKREEVILEQFSPSIKEGEDMELRLNSIIKELVILKGSNWIDELERDIKARKERYMLSKESMVRDNDLPIKPLKGITDPDQVARQKVYANSPEPTFKELSLNEGKYEFEIVTRDNTKYLVERTSDVDFLTLWRERDTNEEIYRMFAQPQPVVNGYSKYLTKTHVGVFISVIKAHLNIAAKESVEFLNLSPIEGCSYAFKRIEAWERPDSQEDINRLHQIHAEIKDPIQAVIEFYKETGRGISYWYIRK